MVNLLQMVFQLFKGSLTFKNQSIIILEGQFRLFTGVQTGLQWLVIITKKNQLVNTWEKGQWLCPAIIQTYNCSVCFKKNEKMTNICK